MNIILVLIPLSVILIVAAIATFFWAVNNDQFEDMDAAALDVLGDDSEPLPEAHQQSKSETERCD